MGAVNGEDLAVTDAGHDATDGHDGGEVHFAGGHGAVGERAAGFSDDGLGGVEEGGPCGVGGGGDEDGTGGEAFEVIGTADEAGGAGGAAGAAGEAAKGVGGVVGGGCGGLVERPGGGDWRALS